MISGIAHVCISATDLEASIAFYRDVLGLPVRYRFKGTDGSEKGAYIAVGEQSFIEIFPRGAEEPAAVAIRHFCLEVPSIDVLIERLKQHDSDVSEKKLGADQSWQCWVTDPGGVCIEFHEYTAESHQRSGADCVVGW